MVSRLGNRGASSPGSSEPEQQAGTGVACSLRGWSVLARSHKESPEPGAVCEGAEVVAGAGSISVSLPRVQEEANTSTWTILFSVQTFKIFDQHLQPSPESLIPPNMGRCTLVEGPQHSLQECLSCVVLCICLWTPEGEPETPPQPLLLKTYFLEVYTYFLNLR